MRKASVTLGYVFAGLLALAPLQASLAADVTAQDLAKPPDATVDFEATQVRLILGGAAGEGVLHFKGKDYKFKLKAATVGGVGATDVAGTGKVHFLKSVEDFAGTYTAIGAGAALVAGKGGSTLQNSKGVVVSTTSKATGVALNLGAGGVVVTLE